MNNKVKRLNLKNKLYKYNYIKSLIYKSVFVLVFLIVLLIIKKINNKTTNNILDSFKTNINYEFNLIEDGKKAFNKTLNFFDTSLEAIGVFKEDRVKFASPLVGTIYKDFNQKITINEKSMKNNGLDIKSISEVDPKIIMDGVVLKVELKGNKGYFVTINNDNMEIVYGYLSKPYVSEGSLVKVGDLIGLLGTNKDGNKYLRLEIYVDGIPVDPMDYIDI